jgi:AcrR family transcriptional regulator
MEHESGRRRGRPPVPGRREEILDAAVKVLAERGIEGLSLAQLAESLGFSTYALTYHFGAKEDLLAAVVTHVEERAQTEFQALAAEPGLTPADLVRRYWATTGEPGAGEAMRLWLEVVLLASRDPRRFPGFLERAARSWNPVIIAALGDRPDAEQWAALAFATMTGLELLQLMDPGSPAPRRAVETFAELCEALFPNAG